MADVVDRPHAGELAAMPDFRSFIDEAVQGVLIHRNFKPLYVNQAFATLLGYDDPQEIKTMPILRPLVPVDEWPRLEQQYDDIMHGVRKSVIGRARAVTKAGAEIWVAVTMRAVDWPGPDKQSGDKQYGDKRPGDKNSQEKISQDKNPARAMMLTAFDITKQVELEHNLLKTEQRLRAVLEVLPYPIYIARRSDAQMLFVNRKSCLLFQQGAGQLLRGRSADLYVDKSDRDNLNKLLENVPDIRDVEVQMKTGQGRVFTAELAAIAMDYAGAPAILVALNDISQRKEMEAELFRQASTDSLTGISNRRYFHNQAEQELRRARRFARDMTVMMIDIDHFKLINDTHGHAAGDLVIQQVVKRAQDCLRQSDSIGRVGGEEFAVLLPEISLASAQDVAERLRLHIQARPIMASTAAVPCSVSIGIAQLTAQDGSVEDLFGRADRALYTAKNNGRNRVEVASPTDRPSPDEK